MPGLAVPALAGTALGGTASAGSAEPGTGTATRFAELRAVDAISAGNVWAVGDHTVKGADRTLVQHWNGRTWSTVPSPSPGGPTGSGLNGVAAISADNVWAVGQYQTALDGARALVLHWNGQRWRQIPVPNPGGEHRDSVLFAVSAVSATNVWAVGYYDPPGAVFAHAFVVRWNGSTWSQVATPSPPGQNRPLVGISMSSASNGWAIGTTAQATGKVSAYTQHWNGHSWVPSRSTLSPGRYRNDLNGVSMVSASNVWAVGQYQQEPRDAYALLEHWYAGSWHRVTVAHLANQVRLLGVDGDAPDNVWVVGYTTLGSVQTALLLHWNGHGWARYGGPDPSGVQIADVTTRGTAAAWAVGVRWSGTTAAVVRERWNGQVWTR